MRKDKKIKRQETLDSKKIEKQKSKKLESAIKLLNDSKPDVYFSSLMSSPNFTDSIVTYKVLQRKYPGVEKKVGRLSGGHEDYEAMKKRNPITALLFFQLTIHSFVVMMRLSESDTDDKRKSFNTYLYQTYRELTYSEVVENLAVTYSIAKKYIPTDAKLQTILQKFISEHPHCITSDENKFTFKLGFLWWKSIVNFKEDKNEVMTDDKVEEAILQGELGSLDDIEHTLGVLTLNEVIDPVPDVDGLSHAERAKVYAKALVAARTCAAEESKGGKTANLANNNQAFVPNMNKNGMTVLSSEDSHVVLPSPAGNEDPHVNPTLT